ncbi:MAG: hypothetical protein BWZ02_00314 [Lentisphaerae bacterium ADurb.BinA184]|nr:MAG: hypothetical protein BWZ02_00314 [Lentisphaerae bacterium ADurb.BinA184]
MKKPLLGLAVCLAALAAAAEPPDYAVKNEQEVVKPFIEKLKERVPPLKHARGKRWPMIAWECLPFEPQPPEVYTLLLDRGLTQHIRLDEKMIPTAQALQAAGAPVIMMEGGGGPWPGSLAGAPEKWQHQFEEGYVFKPGPYPDHAIRPCLGLWEGWAVNAARVEGILRKYKEAGVTVNAAWLDWEGDPYFVRAQYAQASHCARCKAMLPPWVLASPENCATFAWRLYIRLLDTYMAAPVANVFPQCSTTNWMVVFSTPERPVMHWNGRVIPPSMPAMMTATNPVAYGNTVFWKKEWKAEWPLDREHVDQAYMHLLLRQVSDDAANKAVFAPEKDCFPWVDRWCPDDEDPKIPIISRDAYREALRHIWLRGADGMQIFNPTRPGFDHIVFAEIEDAVAVYDEMLAYAEFLDQGEGMSLAVPAVQDDGVLWSGLRLADRAVVRVVKQGGEAGAAEIEPWPGKRVRLDAPRTGRTYVLTVRGDAVHADAQPE